MTKLRGGVLGVMHFPFASYTRCFHLSSDLASHCLKVEELQTGIWFPQIMLVMRLLSAAGHRVNEMISTPSRALVPFFHFHLVPTAEAE